MKEQNPEKVIELNFSFREYIQNSKSLKGKTIKGYTIMRELGRGAFGEVYYAKNNKNEYFALKLLNLEQLKEERNPKVKEIRWRLVKSQPALMMACNSPNVLKCYEILENEELKILVLEYCSGRTLEDYIKRKKRLSEEEAVKILRQIINGVAELHRHSIVHRDLKAENIMDHEGCYKIIDLGFSKKLEISEERAEIKGTTLGTVTTMAPEVMSRKNYGLKADIWSIGVIFFQMIFGQMPYDSISAKQRYEQIEKKQYFNPSKSLTIEGVTASKEASDFFSKVFQVETEKRMDWRELLEHPLIKQKENEPLGPRFLQRQKIEEPIVHKSLIDQHLQDTVQNENEEKQLLEEKKPIKQQQIKKPIKQQQVKKGTSKRFKIPIEEKNKQEKQQIVQPKPEINIPPPMLYNKDMKESFHQKSSPEFRWCEQSHLQCLKTELIMNNIIQPLLANNVFMLEERKAAELMFLLITRCFNNMSPIQYKIENQKDKADPKVINLYNQVKPLYTRVKKQFQQFGDKLTAIENKMINIVKDFFPKRLFQKYQEKSKITSGIEKVKNEQYAFGDYEKNEQIDYTYTNYIVEVLGKINSGNRLRLYLSNYLKLMKISFEELRGQDYSEYVSRSLDH